MWTSITDMHSGGSQKLDFARIAVELPETLAKAWFETKYGRDPDNVTCACCGADYSVWEYGDSGPDTVSCDFVVDKATALADLGV
jgi:hypothetical protein